MYQFITMNNKHFAFKDDDIFRLACYVKLFPEYVYLNNNGATLFHKRNSHTYQITKAHIGRHYRIDLVESKDATQLFALCQHIKG